MSARDHGFTRAVDDVQRHWNQVHDAHWSGHTRRNASRFGKAVSFLLPPAASVLELGCGNARDARYFHSLGHDVTATDLSDVAIDRCAAEYSADGLRFEHQDVLQPFRYPNASFDLVYARLSLHYFGHAETLRIVQEVSRVLRPSGLFCFACRSTDDGLYGKGQLLPDGRYQLDGEVRRFFTISYTWSLLNSTGAFRVLSVRRRGSRLYGQVDASIIEVVAELCPQPVQQTLPGMELFHP